MRKLILTLMVVFLPIKLASAVTVSSLYQAEIPVIAQTYDAKEQAFKEGFLQVLIKVSGDAQIDRNPVIRASMKKAEYFVHEYNYLDETPDSSQYLLQITYESNDVNRLLKKARVAYWGENRPLILVWLVVTDKQREADIVGNEESGGVYSGMKLEGKKFGLPIIFPVMDVNEVNKISPADISTASVDVLKEAAQRYSPDGMLIGEISESDQGAESKWQLIINSSQWNWTIAEKSTPAVISSIMNQVNQTLLGKYAVKAVELPDLSLMLEVSNISKQEDLNQLIKYLKQLTPVQQVELSEVDGDTVDLSVRVRGTLDVFRQHATIGKHLVYKSQNNENNKLVYEWIR